MARKPSVVLTPTERKEAVSSAKDANKAAKINLAETQAKIAQIQKTYDKAVKVLNKQLEQDLKVANKELRNAQKDATAAEAALLKVQGDAAPKAVAKAQPSPISE